MALPDKHVGHGVASDPLRDRSFLWPPWMDAQYQSTASKFSATQIVPTAYGGDIVVPGNPRRWILGFVRNAAALDPTTVAPWQPLSIQGIILDNSHYLFVASIFEYGPLVQAAWYVQSTDTLNPLSWFEVVLQ